MLANHLYSRQMRSRKRVYTHVIPSYPYCPSALLPDHFFCYRFRALWISGVWQKPSQPARCELSRPPAFIVSRESWGVGNTQHSVPQADPRLLSLSLWLPMLPRSLPALLPLPLPFSVCVPAAREFEVGRAPKNLQMVRSRYRNCAEGESCQSWHSPDEHEMTWALQGLHTNLVVFFGRRVRFAMAR